MKSQIANKEDSRKGEIIDLGSCGFLTTPHHSQLTFSEMSQRSSKFG
jgi:hypothetical protein